LDRENNIPWKEVDETIFDVFKNGESPNYTLALQNGGHDPITNVWPARVGEVIEIVWVSDNGPTGGFDSHPMHIHGEHCWDVGAGNGTYNATDNEKRFKYHTPARHDTTILYRYLTKARPYTTLGWRAWRIRVTEDNVGAWMMHCHIAQHSVMGMNTIWQFGDTNAILEKFPSTIFIAGYLDYGGGAYGGPGVDPLINHYFDSM